jgi:hypothetical protein
MEPVGIVIRRSGPGAAGGPESAALESPTHAPTSAAASMDFVQELLWQNAPMGPPGGAT